MSRNWKEFVYHSPDGVEGASVESVEAVSETVAEAVNEAPMTQETVVEEAPQYERPKYFSQVSPAKADSEDYKALWKYQKLDELADAAIALEKENKGLKESASRSIEVPDGKDPEKVKEFAKKLGIPENPEDYKLGDLHKVLDADTLSILRKSAHRAMLSEKQANVFGQMIARISKLGIEQTQKAITERKEKFRSNLEASYTDYSHDTDRSNAADRDMAAFRGFLEETGLAKIFDNNGAAYNPQVVRGIAAYARKHSGQVQVETVPGGKTSNTTNYGKEFYNRYGGQV